MPFLGRTIAPIPVPKIVPVVDVQLLPPKVVNLDQSLDYSSVQLSVEHVFVTALFLIDTEEKGSGPELQHSRIRVVSNTLEQVSVWGSILGDGKSEQILDANSLDRWLRFPVLNYPAIDSVGFDIPDVFDINEYVPGITEAIKESPAVPTISDDLFTRLLPKNIRGQQYLQLHDRVEQTPIGQSAKKHGKRGRPNKSEDKIANPIGETHKPTPKPVDEFEMLYPLLLPPLRLELLENTALPHPLRDYQWTGVIALLENTSFLLADEMGTGKTVMTCVAMKVMFQRGHLHSAVIMCPKSVLRVWSDHLRDWAPELRVNVIRSKDQRLALWNSPAHVYISSYDTLRSDIENAVLNKGKPYFDLVVVDEAQAIKNYDSKRSQAVRRITCKYRWAVTGTPLENRVDDAVSILSFLFPDRIKRTHIKAMSEEAVREELRKCMLRRLKKDVLKDLPPLVRQEIWLEMDNAQLKAYAAEYNVEVDRLRQMQAGVSDFKIRSAAIQAIQRLKQICNFAPNSSKSPKLEALADILEELDQTNQKMVVFSQYIKEGIDKLHVALKSRRDVGVFTGNLSEDKRQRVLNTFRKDPDQRALLISLRAGGTGLTLTEASYVTMFDPWWNPAVMRQAEDRVHRFGQKASRVTVYQLAMSGTIEERIYYLLDQKRRLFTRVVDSLADGALEVEQTLTTGELLSLFNLRLDESGKVVDDPNVQKVGTPSVELHDSAVSLVSLEKIHNSLFQLSPEGFEKVVELVIRKMGYPNTRHTGKTADGGVDVRAWRNTSEGQQILLVQCKRYSNNVGVKEVRDLYGVINAQDGAPSGIIVTSSDFTANARSFAAETGGKIRLMNGAELSANIRRYGIEV